MIYQQNYHFITYMEISNERQNILLALINDNHYNIIKYSASPKILRNNFFKY